MKFLRPWRWVLFWHVASSLVVHDPSFSPPPLRDALVFTCGWYDGDTGLPAPLTGDVWGCQS